MVQNFFTWVASPLFWLIYIPFYERLFPVFVENKMEEQSHGYQFEFRPSGPRAHGAGSSRQTETTYFMSFGRFGSLLRSFAIVFDFIQRSITKQYLFELS